MEFGCRTPVDEVSCSLHYFFLGSCDLMKEATNARIFWFSALGFLTVLVAGTLF